MISKHSMSDLICELTRQNLIESLRLLDTCGDLDDVTTRKALIKVIAYYSVEGDSSNPPDVVKLFEKKKRKRGTPL
jgi:hypothetical protein